MYKARVLLLAFAVNEYDQIMKNTAALYITKEALVANATMPKNTKAFIPQRHVFFKGLMSTAKATGSVTNALFKGWAIKALARNNALPVTGLGTT